MFFDGLYSNLKNAEIEERISKLQALLASGYQNESVINQAYMFMNELTEERDRRYQQKLEKYYKKKGIVNPDKDDSPIDFGE
jgi:hypothetical protein